MWKPDLNDYIAADLAGKYRQTHSQATKLVPEDVVAADLAAVERDGYVVIEKLLTDDELSAIHAAVAPLLAESGRNDFEGLKTQRVYAVLAKTRALDRLVDHPRILALLDTCSCRTTCCRSCRSST